MNPQTLWDFSLRHLRELRTSYGFAASDAGTGLYHTLFGRDSLWTLIFLLEAVRLQPSDDFNLWVRGAGADALLSLCAHQGSNDDPVSEEQPGKIIHEFRDEEAQRDERLEEMGLGFVEGRLYSGLDQTFLFVSACRKFIDTFPGDEVGELVWPHVERALLWIEQYADSDDDGLFEYTRRNPRNLLNQVWKDSFDSIATTGVDIPPHPLAWIEVQAYAYRALLDGADMIASRGQVNSARADRLRARAAELQRKVNRDFWMEDESCLAMALSPEKDQAGDKKKVRMVSSNAGHALWAGIVSKEYEDKLVARLMRSDMATKYGVRTLSSKSPHYAPFSYHRGCIWPFDTAIFVMGAVSYGYREEALRMARGVSEALLKIGSPIELYLVLDADVFLAPRLPGAEALTLRRPNQENRNQLWTAAALLYFAALMASESGIELSAD